MYKSSIISLELNELCPPLLDRWMADGELPHFKQLYETSQIFLTNADTERPDELEPWIQWYSIHTGLPYSQHGVFNLTDGSRAEHEDIWRFIQQKGKPVINFSSMNARPFRYDDSVFMADPWSEQNNVWPEELNIYSRFVAHAVREYSNREDRLGWREYWQFLSYMLRHGLSANTVLQIIAQLGGEKLGNKEHHMRAAILDRLQYDIFANYYRKYRPAFASFFVNSVAHLQHSYWRHMQPNAFTIRPNRQEIDRYSNAIKDGYIAMDGLVGRFVKLAKANDATIIFQSALSQQPFTRYEDRGGQHFLRLKNVDIFLAQIGIGHQSVEPTMTHQYMLRFDNSEKAALATQRLSQLKLTDDREIFGLHFQPGETWIYCGCQITEAIDLASEVRDHGRNNSWPIANYFYPIEGIKSGCHHSTGALWIANGQHYQHKQPVSILDIFPTIADMLGIVAEHDGRKGQSLLPLFAVAPSPGSTMPMTGFQTSDPLES